MSPHDPSTNPGIADPEGDVIGHLDNLEQQFAALTSQVQRLQRLASLGTVSAVLAHEFNNLLTPMVAASQYALGRNEPELMKSALEKALRSGQRLAKLCEKILGMATDDTRGVAALPIAPVAREALDCLGRDPAKDDIALTLDIPDGLAARFNPVALQQVLFNLVLNARQAMAGRPGRLTIAARPCGIGFQPVSSQCGTGYQPVSPCGTGYQPVSSTPPVAPPLVGGDPPLAAGVEITVTDTGRGIRPEHIDRVFEPFFTTKQHEGRLDRGGIGLGLHVCRQLMTEMGGTITAESRPGEGATFRLTLPSVAPAPLARGETSCR